MTGKKITPRRSAGFVLITSILFLVALLILGSYLISIANSESKISIAQYISDQNYYLAETGIHDMLWKIKNDAATAQAFTAGTLSADTDISRNNIFGDSAASYQVSARNTVSNEAWIIATSTYQVNELISRRVVKAHVYKATNITNPWEYSTFSGGRGGQQNGNFTFTGAGVVLISNGGRLHANQVFKVQGCELVINDGGVSSSNVINVVGGGQLTLNNSYQEAPTSTVDMLQIDFDSADPKSWKNRATISYTSAQFNALPDNTTLTGIIYVNGNASLIGKNMTINGVLVVNGTLSLVNSGQIFDVNFNPIYGSGILAEGNLSITTSGGTATIDGLVYSGNTLSITSSGTAFTFNGSIAGFDSRITASGGAIILNYNPEYTQPVTDPNYNPNATLITIDHWEEVY
jgi:Tfp pilus assembly protein PilX